MTQPTHTPAPWTYKQIVSEVGSKEIVSFLVRSDIGGVAEIKPYARGEQRHPFIWAPVDEIEANARLIAAAPEFYQGAVDMLERHDKHAQECNFTKCGCEECKIFRPIVDKARG